MKKELCCLLTFLTLLTGCFKVVISPVKEDKFLYFKQNQNSIYDAENTDSLFISPVNLSNPNSSAGKITKLFLFDFEGHPLYRSIELQEITKNNYEKGSIVLLSYKDNSQLDVYHTENIIPDLKSYESMFNKNVSIQKASIDFRIKYDSKSGFISSLNIIDKYGNHIQFDVRARNHEKDHFSMLAPVGSIAWEPEFFPFIYLKKFALIKIRNSKVKIEINSKPLSPLKLDTLESYYARYSMEPAIWNINNSYEQKIELIKPEKIPSDLDETVNFDDNTKYVISYNYNHPEIEAIKKTDLNNQIILRFSPAIPDLLFLKNNISVNGRFSVGVDNIPGIMGGIYKVKRRGSIVNFFLQPTKGWQPFPGKLWMSTYQWNFYLDLKNRTAKAKWIKTK